MILSAFCHFFYALLPYCRICAFAVFTVVKTDIFTVFINTKFCKQSYNTHTNQCSDNRNGYCYQYTKHLCHEQVIITENKTVPFSYRINRSLCKQACCGYRPIYRRYRDIRMRQVRHHIRISVLVQIMQNNKSG